MAAVFTLNLPQQRRNYRFSLTPLADAMFQLLIFFMLSSGLTPYSLLPLQSAPGAAETPSGGATQAQEMPPQVTPDERAGQVALWTVEAQTLVVGGQRFGFEALDDLAGALGTESAPGEVVLIIRPSAQVQDMTTVLARLRAANVTAVQISLGGEL